MPKKTRPLFDLQLDRAIGQRLEAIRTGLGRTLGDVGFRMSLRDQQVRRYEQGKSSLNVTQLIRFAECYDVDAADLLPRSSKHDLEHHWAALKAMAKKAMDAPSADYVFTLRRQSDPMTGEESFHFDFYQHSASLTRADPRAPRLTEEEEEALESGLDF